MNSYSTTFIIYDVSMQVCAYVCSMCHICMYIYMYIHMYIYIQRQPSVNATMINTNIDEQICGFLDVYSNSATRQDGWSNVNGDSMYWL